MSTAIRATDEVTCPECGGRMWDNRETKRNPKAPDYKCRDRACSGVIWPPKKGMPQPSVKPLTTQGKEPYSSGPRIDAIDGSAPLEKLDRLFALYGVCLAEAIQQSDKLRDADIGTDPQTIASMTATIFIQAAKL